jgi:hypothetical protein
VLFRKLHKHRLNDRAKPSEFERNAADEKYYSRENIKCAVRDKSVNNLLNPSEKAPLRFLSKIDKNGRRAA